jgi:hypothetical protein
MDGKLAIVDVDRRRGLVQIPTMRPRHDVGWAAATGRPWRRRLPLAGEQACEDIPANVASTPALLATRACAWAHPPPPLLVAWEKGSKGEERS